MSDYVADANGPDAEPLESLDQLVAHVLRGAKPESDWVVGTEVERIGVDATTGEAIPFSGPHGVEAVLRVDVDLHLTFSSIPQIVHPQEVSCP